MDRFGLYGKITVIDDQRDTLGEILWGTAESYQGLVGCEIYLVNTWEDEPNAVFVYEVWSNEDAHKASLSLEVIQLLIKRATPIMIGMETISTLQPKGGNGIFR